ncbi:dihydrolipoamide acetyltransferase family protein [Lentibacillus halophilus]|uniref:dihydrolipoamide acetyltransferase family protein n=1 Tax=Lentibacillus halophilus TaxID=295065 RepID=UPI0031D92069
MATEKINMPQLGESVTEGTISSWLVGAGDHVQKYDPIAEVMTDKVNAEVPSLFSGVIHELVAQEGDTVQVGDLICYIESEAENGSDKLSEASVGYADDQRSAKEMTDETTSMKKRYSPAVLKLAQDNHIDLDQVEGTGRGGRITRKDMERLVAAGTKSPSAESAKSTVAPDTNKQDASPMLQETSSQQTTSAGDVEIPVSNVRKAIAQNMVRSTQEIPHAWMAVEVDVTDLVTYRNQMKDAFKKEEGFNLTFFTFFIKAIAQALKEFPQLNSTWAGDKIIQHKDVNISIAVAKGQELYVPVIKHADEKNIKGIAKSIHDLAAKARSDSLTADDMQGGTFTVNNSGSFGSVQSMGVINYPQAAILQVESIVKRPVIVNDMFAARDMVNLCLSLDHRVLDGLIVGQFLARVKEILENINKDTTSVY